LLNIFSGVASVEWASPENIVARRHCLQGIYSEVIYSEVIYSEVIIDPYNVKCHYKLFCSSACE